MSAVEAYQPLLQFLGFFGAWCAAMLTGLMVAKAGD